jgi:hypothetical protein
MSSMSFIVIAISLGLWAIVLSLVALARATQAQRFYKLTLELMQQHQRTWLFEQRENDKVRRWVMEVIHVILGTRSNHE